MRRLCIRYLTDPFLLLAVSDVDVEADLAWNRKSCTIVYGLFYGNIQCIRILGTLWRMRRQCVPGPLFGPGDKAALYCTIQHL